MRTKDRRFIKTEDIIQRSMIKLLNEGLAENLQIDDLINEADINKSTFYLHYQSLDLLVSALEDEFISGLVYALGSLNSDHSRLNFFEKTIDYIKENQKLTKAVLNASTYRLNEKIEEVGKSYLIPVPMRKRNKISSNIELLESALVQAITAYLRVWVFDGCKFDRETVLGDLLSIVGSEVYKNLLYK